MLIVECCLHNQQSFFGARVVYDRKETIDAFLIAAAAKQPTPGGGSVTALVGALAASMGEMVINYSIGKKDLAAHQDELKQVLGELTRARQILLELMIEDQAAFEVLSAIRKLPETDPTRRGKFDAALLACIRIPQAIGASAAAVLKLCERLVDRVNRYLLSDLAVCAELAMATVRCAAYNVRVNLQDVEDLKERKKIDSLAAAQITESSKTIQRLMPHIWAWQETP
jgi:formiminotetrahydrofolate cyclodeaminase